MPNTLITPSIIAREILDRLYENAIMAQLVHRDFEPDFGGSQGDTITVRRPAQFVASRYNRTNGITVQNATETSFPVTLNTLLDVSFAVTAEELTLKVNDFSTQFLDPAATAIALKVDSILLGLATGIVLGATTTNTSTSITGLSDTSDLTVGMGVKGTGIPGGATVATIVSATAITISAAATATGTVPLTFDGAQITQTVGIDGTPPTAATILVDAGKVLNDAVVPHTERAAVLTTTAAANLLKDPIFHSAEKRGDTTGLKEAELGRKFGFDTYQTTNLGNNGDSIAFHKTAFALVTRTLKAPNGVAPSQVSVVNYGGFGIRVVQSYDLNKKQDVISVDALVGAKVIDATRACKILG
jgi:hypothetical protein